MSGAAASVDDYHQRSKHRIDRYAPGPGRLDWANQPEPFREYRGAERISLTPAADSLGTRYNDLRRGALPLPRRIDLASIGLLFELSIGLSAWKSYGTSRWALRCNPSSGNLHPTEGYLACPTLADLPAGVYHYLSRDHVLERRTVVVDARWREAFHGEGLVIALASIFWREAWKYGMRGWRYCQHDCGHAIAALSYAAAALGWQARVLVAAGDDATQRLLGLDRMTALPTVEREAGEALLWIGDPKAPPDVVQLADLAARARWEGQANRLSREHVHWPDIDAIQRLAHKPVTSEAAADRPVAVPVPAAPALDFTFATIARQRRSAVDFDGTTRLATDAFFTMLDCLQPRSDAPPWSAWPEPPGVHPLFLVHRVDGLEPGLYVLVRDADDRARLAQAMRPEWLWKPVAPDRLPLYLLLPLELREAAKWICCHQEIAADGCFALGMLASLEATVHEPWRYRHRFWECGLIGQVLYLEAEAAGVRATGIGCFFDDEMHRLLGIEGATWQSLYHFTAGGPVDDPRLSTLPPYAFQP